MKIFTTASLAVYHRDLVPYWRSNVDVDSLFTAHSHRPDRAQAWLRYRGVSENSLAFGQAVLMRGHFEGGVLGQHTFCWTFTPGQSWRFRDDLCPKNRPQRGRELGPKFRSAGRRPDTISDVVRNPA